MVVKHQSRETTTAQSGTSAHCCEQLLDLIDYFCFPDKKQNYWGWITFHQSVHVMFNDLIYLLVIVRFWPDYDIHLSAVLKTTLHDDQVMKNL